MNLNALSKIKKRKGINKREGIHMHFVVNAIQNCVCFNYKPERSITFVLFLRVASDCNVLQIGLSIKKIILSFSVAILKLL